MHMQHTRHQQVRECTARGASQAWKGGAGGGPEGGARQQQAADAKDGDGKEVHDEDGGARVETGEQADGARAVPASQAQVVEAGLPHLLVRCAAPVAEHLRAANAIDSKPPASR